jgi:hypothetical protein
LRFNDLRSLPFCLVAPVLDAASLAERYATIEMAKHDAKWRGIRAPSSCACRAEDERANHPRPTLNRVDLFAVNANVRCGSATFDLKRERFTVAQVCVGLGDQCGPLAKYLATFE